MGSVLDHLARTCAHARAKAGRGQLDIATVAGVKEATISRFESRVRRCPEQLEAIIAAYAKECGVDAFDLWTDALHNWRDEQDG